MLGASRDAYLNAPPLLRMGAIEPRFTTVDVRFVVVEVGLA
jgi:hypothetical protein